MKLSNSRAKTRVLRSMGRFSCDLAERSGRQTGIAAAILFIEVPPPGYDVLWSIGVGVAIAQLASR